MIASYIQPSRRNNRQIGDQLLELTILILKLVQTMEFSDAQAGKALLPWDQEAYLILIDFGYIREHTR